MYKRFLGLAIFLGFLFFVNSAYAALYDFNSGIPGEFTTYGNATPSSGSVQLTMPANGQAGSIFLNTTLNATSFNASFDFQFSNTGPGSYGADGITFAWVTTPGVGGGGGELGFTGLTGYMVEFDHYWNGPYEAPGTYYGADDTDHIAVGTGVNYNSNQFVSSNTPETENNGWHHVDIAFDNGQIQVSMDSTMYINYLISGYTGFDAYFGFTGSTGASYSRQSIDNFDITINQTSVPEPATMLLLGSGLAGLFGFRRKFKKV